MNAALGQPLKVFLVIGVVALATGQVPRWDQGQGYGGGNQRPGFSYYGQPPSQTRYPQSRNPPQFGPGGQNYAWVGLPQYYYPVYVQPPNTYRGGQGQRYYSGVTQAKSYNVPNWNNFQQTSNRGGSIPDLETAGSAYIPVSRGLPVTTGLQSGNALPPTGCPVGEFRHPVTEQCVKRKIRQGG